MLVYISHCPFRHILGAISAWISFSGFLELNVGMILFSLWLIDSPKWHILFLAKRLQMPCRLLSFSFEKFIGFTDSLRLLFQIAIQGSLVTFGVLFGSSLRHPCTLVLLTIPKLMDKRKLPIETREICYAAWLVIIFALGIQFCVKQSLLTITQIIGALDSALLKLFMVWCRGASVFDSSSPTWRVPWTSCRAYRRDLQHPSESAG